jgi:hypothetical protein
MLHSRQHLRRAAIRGCRGSFSIRSGCRRNVSRVTTDELRIAADDARQARDWTKALELEQQYAKANPESVWGPFWAAYALANMGRNGEGVAMLEAVRDLDPLSVTHRLVEARLEMHDPDGALIEFKRLREIGTLPDDQLDRLAHWYVWEKLGGPGYPPSLFSLDEAILSRVRA